MAGSLTSKRGPTPRTPREDPFRLGWRYVQVPGPDGEPITKQVPLTEEDVLHPQEEDFIVNTPLHHRIADYLRVGIQVRYQDQKKVVVLGDCRVDWQVQQGWAHGPDVGVFFDVKKKWGEAKATFKVKSMGGRCALIIEVTSPSTRGNDYGVKKREYYKVGVPLYVIVDVPEEDENGPINLYGFKAGPDQFEPLPRDERGRLWLAPIGLWLGVDGLNVYLEDAEGNRLPDYHQALQLAREEAQTRKQAERRARAESRARKAEAQARKAAEARLKEVEAELARVRGHNHS
jgi:Uma2 family endonuclease